jgi:hypothetical protein
MPFGDDRSDVFLRNFLRQQRNSRDGPGIKWKENGSEEPKAGKGMENEEIATAGLQRKDLTETNLDRTASATTSAKGAFEHVAGASSSYAAHSSAAPAAAAGAQNTNCCGITRRGVEGLQEGNAAQMNAPQKITSGRPVADPMVGVRQRPFNRSSGPSTSGTSHAARTGDHAPLVIETHGTFFDRACHILNMTSFACWWIFFFITIYVIMVMYYYAVSWIEEIYREFVFGDVEAKIKVLQRENVQLKQKLQTQLQENRKEY